VVDLGLALIIILGMRKLNTWEFGWEEMGFFRE
jgi:hypothetical protein